MERKTPQGNFRDERLDVLAGTRGRAEDRAVRIGELGDLVAAMVAKMLPAPVTAPEPEPDAPLEVPTQHAALSAEVPLLVTGTFYDGPSLTLEAGRYLVLASVLEVRTGTNSENITARIWNGAAAIATTAGYRAGSTDYRVGLTMTAIVSVTTPLTLTVQAATTSGNSASRMLPVDTHITALRIGE